MSRIRRFKELIDEFGPTVCLTKTVWSATKHIPFIGIFANQTKYNAITRFLYKENKDLIESFNQEYSSIESKIGTDSIVWVFWWQGFDAAPDIVKMCINSIKVHSNGRDVIILDKENYSRYVNLDTKYVEMVNDGSITKTAFSDILRLNLLYQQGGIWLDATYLLQEDLSNEISEFSFWTIRHGMKKEYPMSNGLWTGSAIAFSKGNPVLKLIINIYNNYFRKRTILIDYLLIDYIFSICYENSALARKIFEKVPVNNEKVNELLLMIDQPYNVEKMKSVLGKTTMNKLSWKIPMKEYVNGEETFYGHFKKAFESR